MISADTSLLKAHKLAEDIEDLPIREMMVRSFIGQSQMNLGQMNINFGNLDQNDRRTKRILITNKSEIPLLYNILKSGSVASGDISIPFGQSGIIRGYSRKEVEFVFTPSLNGLFQEKLVIENIQNPANDQYLTLKSNIRKPPNFHIENLVLEMGPYSCEQPSTKYRFLTISNTSSKQARVFEVSVDPNELKFKTCQCEVYFSLNSESSNEGETQYFLTKDLVEKIEQLEQKLKIATRKGRDDKAEKIREQIVLLRAGKDEFFAHSTGHEFDRSMEGSSLTKHDTKKVKATDHSLIFPVGPREVKTLKVYFRAKLARHEMLPATSATFEFGDASESPSFLRDSIGLEAEDELPEVCSIPVYIHEQKNQDTVKKVLLRAIVCPTTNCYQSCVESQGSPVGLDDKLVAHVPIDFDNNTEITTVHNNEKSKNSLIVDVNLIDLGRIEVGESRECYFTTTNTTEKTLKFYTTVNSASKDLVGKFENHGTLIGKQVKQVNLFIKPKVLGRGVVSLRVRSSDFTDDTIVVKYIFFAVLPGYLEFSTLGDSDCLLTRDSTNRANWDLDFRYCFIEQKSKFAKVIPLCVKNVTKAGCYITISSNVTQQCFFFLDRQLETQLDHEGLFIQRGDSVYVYIALQSSSTTPSTTIETREFIAGIKFLVHVPERFDQNHFQLSNKIILDSHKRILTYTHRLKLTAIIGQSLFGLDQKLVEFGYNLKFGDKLDGEIIVKNLRPKMPLSVTLSTKNPQLILTSSY